MHFNKKREENTNTTGPGIFDEENFDMYRLIAIDTLNIDQYSRLTLTNKVKNVLNIEAQDKIAVYQNTYNPDELLFRIQRCGGLVDNWKLKRKRMGLAYNEKKSSAPSIVASILDGKGTDSGGSNALYGFHNKNEIRNIILIDDEQDVLYSFQMILSEAGYNVKPFSESKEAVKHLIDLNDSSYYDLAIIDIRMPELNGIQLYQMLKIINKNIRVLFISALDAADEILSLFPEIDPSNIIKKPVSQGYIVSKVKGLSST